MGRGLIRRIEIGVDYMEFEWALGTRMVVKELKSIRV